MPLADALKTRGTYELLDVTLRVGEGWILVSLRTHRVWLSDSNDALERLKIQHNAALFLPMVVTGSHVGPRTCHTSGRTLDIRFRAWVAAQRHMGFEMDPRELTPEDADILRTITMWWRDNRAWMAKADILRLESADPSVIAEQQLAQDGGKFVVFAGKIATSSQILPRPLRLSSLAPEAIYRIELLNRDQAPSLSRGDQLIKCAPLEGLFDGQWFDVAVEFS